MDSGVRLQERARLGILAESGAVVLVEELQLVATILLLVD